MAAKKETSKRNPLQDIVEAMSKEEYRYPVPSSVLILGRQVPIRLDPKLEDDGEFDYKNLGIRVRPAQMPIEEMDTILHETIHAIDHWLDLEMTERQVRLMATALIGLFQDNPDYAEFVTRPLKGIV